MTEADLQVAVARYLTIRYPNVMFHSDFGSGIKMTKGQAIKQKRQNGGRRGWPDMFIAESNMETDGRGSFGLFIELKREGTRLKKKDGTWATEHIKEQAEVLEQLRLRGYACAFCVGFDEAVDTIDKYLTGKKV